MRICLRDGVKSSALSRHCNSVASDSKPPQLRSWRASEDSRGIGFALVRAGSETRDDKDLQELQLRLGEMRESAWAWGSRALQQLQLPNMRELFGQSPRHVQAVATQRKKNQREDVGTEVRF